MIASNSVIQTPHQILLNGASSQTPVDQPQITRHKRDTATPSEPDENSRAAGDSALAVLYGKALLQTTGVSSRDREVMVENIPPNSTFGQWWAQLGRAMSTPEVREWAAAQGIKDPRTTNISPEKGEISFQTKSDRLIKTVGPGDKEWSAVSGPIMAAAKVIAAGYGFSTFQPPLSEASDSAPLWLVKRFYGEREEASPAAIKQRAAELEQDKTFLELPMKFFSGLHEVRSEEALDRQKTVVGDHITEHEAKRTLKFVFNHMQSNQLADSLIDEHLEGQMFQVHPDSNYPKDKQNNLGQTSLKHYVEHNGWEMPTNSNELDNLAAALLNPSPKSPPNANYAGALAWPIPLDSASESHLKTLLRQGKIGDIDLGPFKNVLEYLMGDMTPTYAESRKHPQQIIDRLIQSPKGQALGEAIQTLFDAQSVKGSVNDWLLAALSVHQDDKADTPGISPKANIAGQTFAVPDQVNRTASSFIFLLAEGQVLAGKASTLDKAWVQAHLLLSTRAPEFLVKDIPDKVTFGSHSWVSFVTAVGRLEATEPGSTATMNYADVMRHASIAPITKKERQIEFLAQQAALKDWGAANGLPYPQTAAQMDTVREAFNAQVRELKTASEALSTPMPTGKDLALKYLAAAMPDMAPALFEKKCITLSPVNFDFPGPYSLLDLYLKDDYIREAPTDGFLESISPIVPAISPAITLANFGAPASSRWVSSSSDVSVNEFQMKYGSKQLPALPAIVDNEFSTYVATTEKSIATQIKYLISQQPPDVQKIIEDGEISILREDKIGYTLKTERSRDFWKPYTKERENNNLLLKIKNNDGVRIYEIDLKKGLFTDRSSLGDLQPGKYPADQKRPDTEYVEVKPRTPSKYSSDITHKKTSPTAIPYSFKSERSSYIADAYINNIDLPSLKKQAKGETTFDRQTVLSEKINEFLLNLIPGRSAIVNFMEGKIIEGLIDLAIDALGFVVGIGAAVKGAKAVSVAASTLNKVLQTAKIVGRAAIGALNPVDGFVDLAKAAFTLGKKGAKAATHGFKALIHSADYDLLLASKRFDASSMGTFKFNHEILEGPVVLHNGKWHTYNPITSEAYGPALKDFLPSARINTEDFGKWATADGVTKKVDEAVVNHWKKTVETHRNGPGKNAFENGYFSGNPQTIKGFSRNMEAADVMKLAGNKDLTAEQIGMLVKKYDDIAYEFGRVGSARFIDNIEPRFGEVIPMPQVVYFSQTAQLSDGQCAALSRAMATAMAEGKEQMLIKNMFTAAAFPTDPASREFIAKLSKIQTQVGGQSAFHAGQPIRQLSVQGMVKELADSTVSKSIMIDSPGHAMAAGVKIDGTSKTYYFYDPNHGLANFSSAEAMEKGLERLSRDKKLAPQYKTHSTDPNKLEFKVFDHDDTWQQKNSVFGSDVKKLYDTPILSPQKSTPNTPPAKATNITPAKSETVYVPEYDSATVTDPGTLLTTRGISDCSAIVILSDFKDGIYGKRTLMHLRGSSLNELQSKALKDAQASFADGNTKLVLVGGDSARSPYGIGVTLGQEHNGETLLADLVKKHPNSITITTASGIDVNPDGTFKLIEGIHPVKELNQREKLEVFDFID